MCSFFGTQKATLPSLGPLAKASRAKVVPIYGAYRRETGKLTIYVEPAMEDYPTGDPQQDAQRMNQEVEKLINHAPEQYMWTLMLLKTRPPGELRVYPSDNHPYQKIL
jgi:lauroyl-KDO2-lipid IV(A) myristoyltransferase